MYVQNLTHRKEAGAVTETECNFVSQRSDTLEGCWGSQAELYEPYLIHRKDMRAVKGSEWHYLT